MFHNFNKIILKFTPGRNSIHPVFAKAKHQAYNRDDVAPTRTSIVDLAIDKRVVKLLVQALSKEDVKTFFQKDIDAEGEKSGLLLKIVFGDNTSRIRATCFNKEATEFNQRISLNNVNKNIIILNSN